MRPVGWVAQIKVRDPRQARPGAEVSRLLRGPVGAELWRRRATSLSRWVARISIAWAELPPTATPPAWHVAGVGISHTIATTSAPWLVTRIGIGHPKRAPAASNTTTIAWFITRVGIGLTAAALSGARVIFARQFRFRRHGCFQPLRQGASHRHRKPGAD